MLECDGWSHKRRMSLSRSRVRAVIAAEMTEKPEDVGIVAWVRAGRNRAGATVTLRDG